VPASADQPRVRLGAYGLCRDPAGRLLLARLKWGGEAGRWGLPGGGVEWGEHPDAALRRELEEETGLTEFDSIRLAASYSHTYLRTEDRPFDSMQHVGFVYEVVPRKMDLRAEENGSTDLCEWFTEAEARTLPLTPLGEFAIELTWPDSEQS
jgi:8-oxo-dGTP diphosphatase